MSEFELYAWEFPAGDPAGFAMSGRSPMSGLGAGPFLVTLTNHADEPAVTIERINQPVRLSDPLQLGNFEIPAGATIISDKVLRTADFPARTFVVGRIVPPGADPQQARSFLFSTSDVPPGDTLALADATDARKRAQGQNCFARGTFVETPHGAIPVEHLQDGDEVLTRDGGTQLVSWIAAHRVSCLEMVLSPALRPVRIMAGALTGGRPGQDLVVSQDHRLVVDDWRAEYLFGETEILVPAKSLFNDSNVVVDCPLAGVEYYHLLMEDSSLVCANGLWAETLLPDSANIEVLPPVLAASAALVLAQQEPKRIARTVLPALSVQTAASIAA